MPPNELQSGLDPQALAPTDHAQGPTAYDTAPQVDFRRWCRLKGTEIRTLRARRVLLTVPPFAVKCHVELRADLTR
jgi:hypothetical protein